MGFTIYGINSDVNIWPIVRIFLLSLSIPSITGLNIVGNAIKKTKTTAHRRGSAAPVSSDVRA